MLMILPELLTMVIISSPGILAVGRYVSSFCVVVLICRTWKGLRGAVGVVNSGVPRLELSSVVPSLWLTRSWLALAGLSAPVFVCEGYRCA